MIIIYQKLKSHKHTQTRPGTPLPLALPLPAQGVGILNSLALRQNLSPQLPGATWCLTPATQALFSRVMPWGSPSATLCCRGSWGLPLLVPLC